MEFEQKYRIAGIVLLVLGIILVFMFFPYIIYQGRIIGDFESMGWLLLMVGGLIVYYTSKDKWKFLLVVVFLVLIILTFATKFYGTTDIADYSDVAKFFAGDYSAKIRSSHSYLFGFIHSPFVKLTHSYIIFKISSLIFLALIIYSIYIITNKNKKALWMMTLSPIVWYMSPWINPIQLAGLLFLWCYYYLEKFDKTNRTKFLLVSGIFAGLSWAFWDTMIYLVFFLWIAFLYNKKLAHSFYFFIFILIGLSPRLILDQYLFNFPFYTIIKSTMGGFSNVFGGGIYSDITGQRGVGLLRFFLPLLAIPIYFWRLIPKIFKNNKKAIIFLAPSLFLFISVVPQIRYIMALAPIIIYLMSKHINKKQFKRQIILSIIVILLFIFPYIIQINYSIIDKLNGTEISNLLEYLIARGG